MKFQEVSSHFPTGIASQFADFLGPPAQTKTAAPSGVGSGGQNCKAGELREGNYHSGESVQEQFADLLGATSVLDQPIALTCFPTQTAGRKDDVRVSLREFAAHVEKQSAADKGSLPWFKLARFGDKRTAKHSLRSDANVIAVSGVEGDYDAGVITPAEAEARLHAGGIAALVYTTPSHSPERPRWRVFAPFAKERAPDERKVMVERLNGLFDGELDGASFTLSEPYRLCRRLQLLREWSHDEENSAVFT